MTRSAYAEKRMVKLAPKINPNMKRKLVRIYSNFVAAIQGRTKEERRHIRARVHAGHKHLLKPEKCNCQEALAFARAQDLLFPESLKTATKVLVVVIPEHNSMSGGIYSCFSIANQLRQLKRVHGYEIIVMTRPTIEEITYIRNIHFRNSETVFRFGQIVECRAIEDLYVLLPEYCISSFADLLSGREKAFLQSRRKFQINILNQNIKLMPERPAVDMLRSLTPELTQSVAHHAYFNQEVANRYGIPTLLLPAYTDLTPYPPAQFREKSKLIIYSPDEAPYKQAVLSRLATDLPEYQLLEIRDISFDRFMELATQCMFSITFGEGFDGYLNQPILQGGIGFAVFNPDFFPSTEFQKYQNLFSSPEQMIEAISERVRTLAGEESTFTALNAALRAEHDKLYSLEGYVAQIKKLALKDFEIFPA